MYNIFYLSFSITFDYDLGGAAIVVDIIVILLYWMDIWVYGKTLYYDEEEKKYVTNDREIWLIYLNSYFFLDFIACIPFDYFLLAF